MNIIVVHKTMQTQEFVVTSTIATSLGLVVSYFKNYWFHQKEGGRLVLGIVFTFENQARNYCLIWVVSLSVYLITFIQNIPKLKMNKHKCVVRSTQTFQNTSSLQSMMLKNYLWKVRPRENSPNKIAKRIELLLLLLFTKYCL